MSNQQRFLVIIQLCLTFSVIFWFFAQPFMGEYFSIRSRMLVYEYVLGTSNFVKNQENLKVKLERNSIRFEQLPLFEKKVITQGYQNLQNYAQRPASVKIADGLKILFFHIPPFQLAWLFFSLILGVMLLLNKTGAPQAAWLLPIIALCYGIDNHQNGKILPPSEDIGLFPSEKQIIEEYSGNRMMKSIISQNELKEAWDFYLVNHWTNKPKSASPLQLDSNQLEEAEFNFTTARLMFLGSAKPNLWISTLHEKSHPILLALYFIWNLYFAWMMNKSRLKQ